MSLSHYLTQLCEDLRACEGQFPPPPDLRTLAPDPGYPDFMEGSMQYLYGPRYRMSKLFEIEVERFPPVDQLTDEEQLSVVQAILQVWRSLNIEAVLPKEMPLHLAYPALVCYWEEEEISIVTESQISLEFCHYEPSACPWPLAYCQCKA